MRGGKGARVRAVVVTGVVLALAWTAELGMRVMAPRGGLVRGAELVGEDAAVTWRTERPEVVRAACTFAGPGAVRVVVLGGAILRGDGLAPGDVFTERTRLAFDASQLCLDNWAQPGAGADQLAAELDRLVGDVPTPDTVILGLEEGFASSWRRVGDVAVRGEVPAARWLGGGVAGELVAASAVARWALVRSLPERTTAEALGALDASVARAQQAGIDVVVWRVPDTPLGGPTTGIDGAALARWADGHAVVVDVGDLTSDVAREGGLRRWTPAAHGALAASFSDNLRRLVIARAHGW